MKVEVRIPEGEICNPGMGTHEKDCPLWAIPDCNYLRKRLNIGETQHCRRYGFWVKHPDCPSLKVSNG